MDQAIAHGAGVVTGDTVREMLGLADRTQVIDLFEAIDARRRAGGLRGIALAIRCRRRSGGDPLRSRRRSRMWSPASSSSPMRRRIRCCRRPSGPGALEFAQTLSVRTLSRAWQILLKGIPEVQASNRPVAAAEMVLVRLAYAADLPTPDEALRALKDGAPRPQARPVASAPSRPAGACRLRNDGACHVAGAAAAKTCPRSGCSPPPSGCAVSRMWWRWQASSARSCSSAALERDVRLVRFEEGHIEFSLAEGASRTIANDLSRALQQWTGRTLDGRRCRRDAGAQTLHEQAESAERERKEGAANHPLVQAVLAKFPGAQIVNVVDRSEKTAEDAAPGLWIHDRP